MLDEVLVRKPLARDEVLHQWMAHPVVPRRCENDHRPLTHPDSPGDEAILDWACQTYHRATKFFATEAKSLKNLSGIADAWN